MNTPAPIIAPDPAAVAIVISSFEAEGFEPVVTRMHCQSFVVTPTLAQDKPALATVSRPGGTAERASTPAQRVAAGILDAQAPDDDEVCRCDLCQGIAQHPYDKALSKDSFWDAPDPVVGSAAPKRHATILKTNCPTVRPTTT